MFLEPVCQGKLPRWCHQGADRCWTVAGECCMACWSLVFGLFHANAIPLGHGSQGCELHWQACTNSARGNVATWEDKHILREKYLERSRHVEWNMEQSYRVDKRRAQGIPGGAQSCIQHCTLLLFPSLHHNSPQIFDWNTSQTTTHHQIAVQQASSQHNKAHFTRPHQTSPLDPWPHHKWHLYTSTLIGLQRCFSGPGVRSQGVQFQCFSHGPVVRAGFGNYIL